MTRLVNFGLGEICDRVSILSLKILYGEQKKVDTAHFRNERNVLLTKMAVRDNGRWLEDFSDLAAVNAALWRLEDAIRELRDVQDFKAAQERIAGVGMQIAALNDKRAQLVGLINALVGDRSQEKV